MHHHQQTLADLEREQQPSDLTIFLGGAALACCITFICIFIFSI